MANIVRQNMKIKSYVEILIVINSIKKLDDLFFNTLKASFFLHKPCTFTYIQSYYTFTLFFEYYLGTIRLNDQPFSIQLDLSHRKIRTNLFFIIVDSGVWVRKHNCIIVNVIFERCFFIFLRLIHSTIHTRGFFFFTYTVKMHKLITMTRSISCRF